jgi:hypothetical protein
MPTGADACRCHLCRNKHIGPQLPWPLCVQHVSKCCPGEPPPSVLPALSPPTHQVTVSPLPTASPRCHPHTPSLQPSPYPTHVKDLRLDCSPGNICQLVEQQTTSSTSSNQQTCHSHWAGLLHTGLVGVTQLQLSGLHILLQARLSTSKTTSSTGCRKEGRQAGVAKGGGTGVSTEFAACRCDSNQTLYLLLQTGFLQANPPVAPTAGRRGRSGWRDRVSRALHVGARPADCCCRLYD